MKDIKIALVTGGGTGIGKAISERLYKDGYIVIAAGLENDQLSEVITEEALSAQIIWRQVDLTNDKERDGLFGEINERFGRLDLLVNNAGLSGLKASSPALSTSLDFLRNMLDINLVSAFACAQSAASIMKNNQSGVIVNISSVAGSAAQFNGSAYCMSKGAMDAMTRSLALEWAEYGIRMVGIAPGDIITNNSEATKAEAPPSPYVRTTPLGRAGSADEIASTVAFFASSEASFITGDTMRVDGGFLTY